MESILFDLNYLGESSQEELTAYRKLGSVSDLKRLKRQEARRIKRIRQCVRVLKNLLLGAFLVVDLWLILSWVDIVSHNLDPNPVYQAVKAIPVDMFPHTEHCECVMKFVLNEGGQP